MTVLCVETRDAVLREGLIRKIAMSGGVDTARSLRAAYPREEIATEVAIENKRVDNTRHGGHMFGQRFFLMLALMACGLLCASAQAGQIVTGATVLHVSSTNGNTTAFQMLVAGGSGLCTSETGTWIVFPLSAAADADTHKRTYAAALLALATGMRVNLHNYSSDSCTGASYVDVYN